MEAVGAVSRRGTFISPPLDLSSTDTIRKPQTPNGFASIMHSRWDQRVPGKTRKNADLAKSGGSEASRRSSRRSILLQNAAPLAVEGRRSSLHMHTAKPERSCLGSKRNMGVQLTRRRDLARPCTPDSSGVSLTSKDELKEEAQKQSVAGTSDDQNGNGAESDARLQQEENNRSGNINWRRRSLQAAKGDERPITAPPPDFVSDRPQRPFRIFLVRHGESEGNVDESMYTRIPDSKISLTEQGKKQAEDCGRRIREIIKAGQPVGDDNWMVYFYVSPYLRTLQTLRGIGAAFERRRIAGVREEPRLREQDFGNFQDREKMRVEKTIRLRFGRFFYRFPDGESAADVYDRVTGFRETLRTDIDVGRFQKEISRNTNMNLVLVSHGLTLRVFLMRWYKWTVDQFQQIHNFGNADFLVLELGPGGRYSLMQHQSEVELTQFGFTPDMIEDQKWQIHARPGDLNPDWPTSGPCFFDYFENLQEGDGLKYPDRSPQFEKIIHDLECPITPEEMQMLNQFPT